MKFFFIDFFLGSVFIVINSSISYISALYFEDGSFYILSLFLFFFIYNIIIIYIFNKFVKFDDGYIDLNCKKSSLLWKFVGFLYIFPLGLIVNRHVIPINVRSLFYFFLGADIGKNVMIGGKLIELSIISVGDYSVLGEDCVVTAHAIECGYVYLGRIDIGKNVTIGVKAVVMPNVFIGDGAIVAAGAVVTKGTRIAPGEIWGGVPARKIGMVAPRSAA